MSETNGGDANPTKFEIDDRTGKWVASKSNPSELEKEAFKILGIVRQIDPTVQLGRLLMQSHNMQRYGAPDDAGWALPAKLRLTHSYVKNVIKEILGLGEITPFNLSDKLKIVEKILVETHELVDRGKDLYEEGLGHSVDFFPKSHYLDYLQTKSPSVKINLYSYLVLAALEIAEFELAIVDIRDSYSDIEGKQEYFEKYICASEFLSDAQTTFNLGLTHTLNESLGDSAINAAILDEYKPGINAQRGREKRQQAIREEYHSQILEVDKRVKDNERTKGKKGVTESCGHVLNELGLKTGDDETDRKAIQNLRRQYYKWMDDPKGYIPSDL